MDSLPSRPAATGVAILLCTFNGERFLAQQIESILGQTFRDWTLFVSDDGSADSTLSILRNYQKHLGFDRLLIFEGPNRGFAENFMSLVRRVPATFQFYAFSDQDDVWHNDKLTTAVNSLAVAASDRPALYCSRTRLVDAQLQPIGYSPAFHRTPDFRNALVQSLAGSNTMLLNSGALALLSKVPKNSVIVAHDWLAYILVTACNGTVIYDLNPGVDYRQHQDNVIGANSSLRSRIRRFQKTLSGRFSEWSSANIQILNCLRTEITDENIIVLDQFKKARMAALPRRVICLFKSGVYRQTWGGNLSLIMAVLLKKI
jgi:glycosyltransferase involved in cell wall biosynthesis